MTDPRYAIGIDLGTTHSALSYVDLQASDGEKTADGVLPVPQLTAPGTVEALPLLPSFLYLPHPDELAEGELALPWSTGGETAIAGEMARSRGASTRSGRSGTTAAISSGTSSSRITRFSHSPRVMPERRARSFATSRAFGSIPLTLQGAPALIRIASSVPNGG